MSRRNYLLISAVLFALVATAHLARLVLGWPFEIGGTSIPHWVSVPGFVVPGLLSAWGFRLAKDERSAG